MVNFFDKIFTFLRKNLVWFFLALIALNIVYYLFILVDASNAGAGFIAGTVITLLIELAVFGYAVYALIIGDKKRFSMAFVVYFAYLFMSQLFSLGYNLAEWPNDAMLIIIQLLSLLFCLCVVVAGFLVCRSHVLGKIKFENAIKIIVVIALALQLALFVLQIVQVCRNMEKWYGILVPLISFAIVAVFGLFYFDDEKEFKKLAKKPTAKSAKK